MELTRDVLWRHVEQPEPGLEGDWFVIPLEDLRAEGWTHIEIHCQDGQERPNMIRVLREPES